MALLASNVRSRILPFLIHSAAACAGVLLYAALQYLAARWPEVVDVLVRNSAGVRLGLVLGAALELGLLGTMLFLPFSARRRTELKETFGIALFEPRVYLLVWAVGSLAYHFIVTPAHPGVGGFQLAGRDWPLGVIAAVLAAGVLMPGSRRGGARTAAGEPAWHAGRAEGKAVSDEEQTLKERVEALRREAELAERRWAATVLQERAARIHAERFAQEFAEARRVMEARAAAEHLPTTMTLADALRVLRLVPGCTPAQAHEAYHRLLLKYHPDKLDLFGSAIRETAERESKRINMAYALVKHSLRAPASPAPRPS